MIRLKILAVILVLLAFTPIIKLRTTQEKGGWEDLRTTERVVRGLHAQNLLFLTGSDVNAYVMNHWNGTVFDCNQTLNSKALQCTRNALTILNHTESLQTLTREQAESISGYADKHYEANRKEAWFGPEQVRNYQVIKQALNQTVPESIEQTLNESRTRTGWAEFQGGEETKPEPTYHAIKTLQDQGENWTVTHDFTGDDYYSRKILKKQKILERDELNSINHFFKVYAPPNRFTKIEDAGTGMEELSQAGVSIPLLMVIMIVLAIILWNL